MRLSQFGCSIIGRNDVIRCARKEEYVILNSNNLELPQLVKLATLPVCLGKVLSIVVRYGRLGLTHQVDVVGNIVGSS